MLTAGTVVATAVPASAHVELTGSNPVNGTTLTDPVHQITLEFLNPVTAVEDQFALLDGNGDPIDIVQILPASGASNTLEVVPVEPLADGEFGLKWSARAGDSHPRVGTVTFTVTVPTAVAESPGAAETTPESEHPAGAGGDHPMSSDLEAALAPPDTTAPARLAGIARFLMYGGLLVAIGGILYLALVHRGTRAEGRRLIFLVRRAALLAIAGTLLELPLQAIILDGGSADAIAAPGVYGELLGGDFGTGMLLRLVGAALVLAGMRVQLASIRESDDPAPTSADSQPTFEQPIVGHGGIATRARGTSAPVETHRVRVESSPLALAGAVALVASIAFIGHTASSEPRWLVIASAVVHVTAGGLWVAGVAMLAATLWRRHRSGAELEAALLAARFSVAAVASVAAIAVSGLALGIAILGDVGSLFSTDFGRVLLLKVGLVGVLVALGAYNQRVLIPTLDVRRRGRSRAAGHKLRRVVTAEVITFLAVVAATAALVGSSST